MKSNITRFSLCFGLVLFLISQSLVAQDLSDYVIVENGAPNQALLQEQFHNNPRVFFNESQKPAMYVYDQMLQGKVIDNLHLYIQTRPGVLTHGGGEITSSTIDTFADVLSGWSSIVQGKIIIHSTDVFSGLEGTMLKSKLEASTGCTVEMNVSVQPFSK